MSRLRRISLRATAVLSSCRASGDVARNLRLPSSMPHAHKETELESSSAHTSHLHQGRRSGSRQMGGRAVRRSPRHLNAPESVRARTEKPLPARRSGRGQLPRRRSSAFPRSLSPCTKGLVPPSSPPADSPPLALRLTTSTPSRRGPAIDAACTLFLGDVLAASHTCTHYI